MNEELPKYGKTVQLIYGGGSIKKNGIYNQVMELLKESGKMVIEDGGVMPKEKGRYQAMIISNIPFTPRRFTTLRKL